MGTVEMEPSECRGLLHMYRGSHVSTMRDVHIHVRRRRPLQHYICTGCSRHLIMSIKSGLSL